MFDELIERRYLGVGIYKTVCVGVSAGFVGCVAVIPMNEFLGDGAISLRVGVVLNDNATVFSEIVEAPDGGT